MMLGGIGFAMSQCSVKISEKLCAHYLAAADTAYLQVRIVLDAQHEGTATFDKTKPIVERPLRTWSEELISTYDLRQLDHPESAYVRMYAPDDLDPIVYVVTYHNASVTKANLDGVISKSYVVDVEPPCWRLSVSLCNDINTRSDSSILYFSIFNLDTWETDTNAQKTFLSGYPVRDTIISGNGCFGSGYLASPPTIRNIGKESGNVELERGSMSCILETIQSGPKPGKSSRLRFYQNPLWIYRCDGRTLPTQRIPFR